MRSSTSGLSRILLLLLLVSAIGLAGCDTTGVQPDIPDPDAPMTESEFKTRMAQDGVVVLSPKDYGAFGITNRDVELVEQYGENLSKASNCTTLGGRLYTYSVCTDVSTTTIYNVDYFRVTIDAEITRNFICPSEPIEPIDPIEPGPIEPTAIDGSGAKSTKAQISCPAPNVSVTSTTVRDDGVILQANDNDTGSTNAETNFVAVYPQADDFEFHHVSTFAPVNNSISATVTP